METNTHGETGSLEIRYVVQRRWKLRSGGTGPWRDLLAFDWDSEAFEAADRERLPECEIRVVRRESIEVFPMPVEPGGEGSEEAPS